MTRYEAFQKLGPRAIDTLRQGFYVHANGHVFSSWDLLRPPQPTQGSFHVPRGFFTGDKEETFDNNEPEIDLNNMPITPHIILDKEKFEVVTPYNASFVRGLKGTFSQQERSYNFKRKVWTVDRNEQNLNLAKSLIKQHFNLKPQMFSKDGNIQATNDTAVDVTSKYGILNVSPSASQKEIKKAFYRIAKRLHPDTSEADAEFFHLAKKAYDTLKDPKKRRRYDIACKLLGKTSIEEETGLKLSSKDLMT